MSDREGGHVQNRDDRNGRYAFDGDMSRMCVCGHTLGEHFAGAPHECAVHSWKPYTPCDCPKFRLSRRKRGPT